MTGGSPQVNKILRLGQFFIETKSAKKFKKTIDKVRLSLHRSLKRNRKGNDTSAFILACVPPEQRE